MARRRECLNEPNDSILMTIDAELAWTALLQARAHWRVASGQRPIEAPPGASIRLMIMPDGTWRSCGSPVSAAAAALLELYLPLIRPGRFAIGQLGQSLDGRIATRSGHSHYVTGPESLDHLHRLRALADAVVVGAGTVLADDPQLTVRHCPGTNPLRVVLDPRRRLPPDRRVFTDGQAPTLVIGATDGPAPGRAESAVLPLDPDDAGFRPADVLALLASRGAERVLIEGGGVTVSRFLLARTLDLLHVVVAPILIGEGRQGVSLPAIERLDDAWRPAFRRVVMGGDVLYELRLT
jgi:diaminohydroxyphosphoribosylaminopyrimidine deaminase/5-amino-6-(5-phosphoribosylamino)uracil reductase